MKGDKGELGLTGKDGREGSNGRDGEKVCLTCFQFCELLEFHDEMKFSKCKLLFVGLLDVSCAFEHI